jgi:hypothetical protein
MEQVYHSVKCNKKAIRVLFQRKFVRELERCCATAKIIFCDGNIELARISN